MTPFRQTIPIKFAQTRKSIPSREVMIPLMDRIPVSLEQQISQIDRQTQNPTGQRMSKLKDASYIFKLKRQTGLQKLCNQLDRKYSIISPDSRYFLGWNILLITAILFNFFELPVSIFLTEQVFKDQFQAPLWIFINILFLFIVLIDTIAIRPNLAFYSHGQLITNRYKIMRNYFRFEVHLDVISFLVLLAYISLGYRNIVYVKLFFYLKSYSLYKVDKALINYLQLHKLLYSIYLLFRIFFILTFIVIWISSIYFAIDYSYYVEQGEYYQNAQLWLTDTLDGVDFIQEVSWPYWLVYAVYWASQITATIGYGVVTPRNPVTVLYCSFVIILMTVIFALFINTIWGIIAQLEESGADYYENWSSLNRIFRQKQISKQLNVRVSQYFHQAWKLNDKKKANRINQSLSEDLLIQLRTLSHLHVFHNMPLFQAWEQKYPKTWIKFKIKIFNCLQTQELAQNQTLAMDNNEQNMFYCVLKGRMKVKLEGNTQDQQFLFKINERFGYEEFFMEKPLTYIAQADCFTRLSKIQRSRFISCLKQFPVLYFQYVREMQKLKFTIDRTLIGQTCFFCHEFHTFFKCPLKTRWHSLVVKKDIQNATNMKTIQAMDKTQSQSRKVYRNFIRSQKVYKKKLCNQVTIDEILHLPKQQQKQQRVYDQQIDRFNF